MRLLSKVLWREGMHLTQHHFQAQSRYVEETLATVIEQLHYRPFGVVEVTLDAAALRNGTVMLRRARGIMPDGLPFDMPDADPFPEPREIRDVFSPTQLHHGLQLAIGPFRATAGNVATGDDGAGRYAAERRVMRDAVSGRDEQPVEVGRKRFRLLLDHEPQEGLVVLPVARIRRDGSGHFEIDPDFIPPCTKIGGSPRLVELLSRAVQMIEAKSSALATERDAARANIADYAAHEIASFWLLHTLRSHGALLQHHLLTREAHPERLFIDLARFVGALSTFTLKASATDVPAYDHEHLSECFGELERLLLARLEVVVPSQAMRVALEPAEENLFAGRVEDPRAYRRARWILGLRSSAPERTIVGRAPDLLKVCSRRFALELARRGRSGLPLTHLPSAPSAISPRADTQYFALALEGPCWKDLGETHEVGVYVPDLFTDAAVDLQVLTSE